MPSLWSDSPVLAEKDPDNVRTYTVWLDRALPSIPVSVTLVSVAIVEVVPAGLTASGAVATGDYAVVSTAGGTADIDYAVTLRCTLSDAQTRDYTIIIPCRER